MKRPIAVPITNAESDAETFRAPRAFAPDAVPDVPQLIEPFSEPAADPGLAAARLPKGLGFFGKLLWGTGAALITLTLGLAADQLIRDLFAYAPWLGWVGIALLAMFVLALIGVAAREILSLARLSALDKTRRRAVQVLVSDRLDDAKHVLGELTELYVARPDLARANALFAQNAEQVFDGRELILLAERQLLSSLDARAKMLTATSARRVALVTALSPRALVDIAFVTYESMRLGGQIARLYGARPGFFGALRLIGAILSHLAVTGGLVLTDGIMEQLIGQGLAAKLSARLGEGIVNGLMTVRVGIAAMRVARPLPFTAQPQPMVKDFVGELANLTKAPPKA